MRDCIKIMGAMAVLVMQPLAGAVDFAIAFESSAQAGIDAVTQENQGMMAALASHYRIATVSGSREIADAGGLAGYGVSYPDLYYRAAGPIDKTFKGTLPGDLPVEQPTKLEMIVNLKTTKALGLEIPPTLLVLADEVIE